MDYFEKVREIMTESLNLDADTITPEANLREDLEIDSLDAVELIMNIESNYGITIEDDAIENIKTVGDIVNLVQEKLG